MADAVSNQDEPSPSHGHGADECAQAPVDGFVHPPGVAAHLIVVDVVDADVIHPQPPPFDTARRLSAPEGDEHGTVGADEFPVRPKAVRFLPSEIMQKQVIPLELRLQVGQQPPGHVRTL